MESEIIELELSPEEISYRTFLKRTMRKYVSMDICFKLMKVRNVEDIKVTKVKREFVYEDYNRQEYIKKFGHTPVKGKYANISRCNQSLTQDGQKLTGRYCSSRICLVCTAIKTAVLINHWEEPIRGLNDSRFLTVSRKNVRAKELKQEILDLIKMDKQIRDALRKRGIIIKGFRKLEVTCKDIKTGYHPHFHFVIEGENEAEAYRLEWIKRNKKKCEPSVQQNIAADLKVGKELFKYFTKIFCDSGGKKMADVKKIDVIFRALIGVRIYQSMGITMKKTEKEKEIDLLKKNKKVLEECGEETFEVSEKLENLLAQIYPGLIDQQAKFIWDKDNFYNIDTGEILTNFKPSSKILELCENIHNSQDEFKDTTWDNYAETMQKIIPNYEGNPLPYTKKPYIKKKPKT